MNTANKWLFSVLTLLSLVVSASAGVSEAAQKSIVPEQDRICNEKCKSLITQTTEHEGCMIQCAEAAKKSLKQPTQSK